MGLEGFFLCWYCLLNAVAKSLCHCCVYMTRHFDLSPEQSYCSGADLQLHRLGMRLVNKQLMLGEISNSKMLLAHFVTIHQAKL